jgi:solute carrier family 25 phosphate transporter 3
MNDAFVRIYNREGMRGLWTGLGATTIGYSIQGACKFGFFEVFKDISKHTFGEENSKKHSLAIYIAGSAAAETISSICLCPWEVSNFIDDMI